LHDDRLRADLVPDTFRAEALAEKLGPHVQGKRVLWARASRGRDVLPLQLREAGATVEELVVYQNLDVGEWPAEAAGILERGELDWIGLSSPSIARNLARLLPPAARQHLGRATKIASISPVTTAAARDAGLPVNAEAATYTWDGLLAAIAKTLASDRAQS
jgi:uroporphyrinogen III methyltransferase/synthase